MERRKNIIRKTARLLLLAMLVTFLCNTLPPVTFAKQLSSDEIEEQIKDLEEEQKKMEDELKQLESQIKDNRNELKEIVAQKNVIDKEIVLINSQIANINERIAAYSLLIADRQDELEKAQAELEALRKKNKERIRAMEEGGTLSYWTVLFEANSFSDLLDRINMIQEIASADSKRINEMDKATQAVEEAKKELDAEKETLSQTRKGMEDKKLQLAKKQEESNALLSELIAEGEEFNNLVADAEAKADELMEQIMKKEDELSEAEKREYEEWLAMQKPPVGSVHIVDGIAWLMPVDYRRFSSPFGMRFHPVHKEWRMHKGVDLTAPTGTPIYATRSGIVIGTGYDEGGAGNYVTINHTDGYKSIYMHMTNYVVKYNERVVAGQLIGYVGSTGASTGPHLHFGIYYNGEPVNPAKYLNITYNG